MTILKSKLDVLIAARQLIADEEHWTQGVPARDKFDKDIPYYYEEACKFCCLGAIWRCGGGTFARDELRKTIGQNIAQYNDTHSHAKVLSVWDITIERLRSQDETIRRVAAEAVTN